MALFSVFEISGTGMTAQSIRLNTVASNLANAGSIASTPEKVYKPKHPVFETMLVSMKGDQSQSGVRVTEIIEDTREPQKIYDPKNPLADKNGFIYKTNVNTMEEMTNMLSSSHTFRKNIEVLNTVKQMIMATINMGRQ